MLPKVLGVCGLICSGKSYFSKLISEKFGYKYLDCDSIFKNQMLHDIIFRESIQKFFKQYGIECFLEDGKYNSKDVSEFLFGWNSEEHLKEFNSVVRTFLNPLLHDQILKNEYVLIEMATLPDNPIKYLCDEIVCIYNKEHGNQVVDKFVSEVIKRDPNRKEFHVVNIMNNQYESISSIPFEKCLNTYDVENQKYFSDEELIKSFLNIVNKE